MKRSGLRPDPEKVRAWQQRARERALGREVRRAPLGPGVRRDRPRLSTVVRAMALARNGGRCVWPGCAARATDPHHVLPKQANKWPTLVDDPDNIVGLCRQHHMDHEFRPGVALPRSALPDRAIALADRVGAGWYVDKTYGA